MEHKAFKELLGQLEHKELRELKARLVLPDHKVPSVHREQLVRKVLRERKEL